MANKVLQLYPSIDYALIERTNEKGEVYEYVCAWHYDEKTKEWGQGHYFFDLLDAYEYLDGKIYELAMREYEEVKEAEYADYYYGLTINN